MKKVVGICLCVLLFFINRSAIGADIYEPTDDQQKYATPIFLDSAQQHNFHSFEDVDWLKVVLPRPAKLTVEVTDENDIHSMLIFSSSHKRFAYGNASGCSFCGSPGRTLTTTEVLYPDIYFIKMTLKPSNVISIGEDSLPLNYTVKVTSQPAVINDNTDVYEPDNWTDQATIVTNAELQEHYLGNSEDRDWYVFRLNQCLEIEPQVFSLPNKFIRIRLLKNDLTEIAESIRSQETDPDIEYNYLQKRLNPGIYYLTVDVEPEARISKTQKLYLFRLLAFRCRPVIGPAIDILLSD